MFLIFVGLPMSLAITTRWSRNFFVHLWVVYLYKVNFDSAVISLHAFTLCTTQMGDQGKC